MLLLCCAILIIIELNTLNNINPNNLLLLLSCLHIKVKPSKECNEKLDFLTTQQALIKNYFLKLLLRLITHLAKVYQQGS